MNIRLLSLATVFVIATTGMVAQTIITPMESQRSWVGQTIGVTNISIEYSRPGVKGRKVWGELVPYNKVWRAGANENTVFKTSTDVTIEGQSLKAGTYGVHMIPTESSWTIIFNKDHNAWGSYFYKEGNDALRVVVTPKTAEMRELLTYEIPDVSDKSCVVSLRWDKLDVRFSVGVDLNSTVLEHLRTQLTTLHGFNADMYADAAMYVRQNKLDAKTGKTWAETALRSKPSYGHYTLLASYEKDAGNDKVAKELNDKALTVATPVEINLYAYQLLNEKKFDDAIALLKENTKRTPEDPNAWDSLGEAYALSGDKAKARENFKKSLSMNPPDNVRKNSEEWLKKLN